MTLYDELISMGHTPEWASKRCEIQEYLDMQQRLEPAYNHLRRLPYKEVSGELGILDEHYSRYQDEIDRLYAELRLLEN